jgi:hypothetical protein
LPEDDSTRGDRATIALVAEKVESLREITKSGFKDLQRQLDDVRGLPIIVEKLRSDFTAQEERHESDMKAVNRRVDEVVTERKTTSEWRRGQLPLIVFAGISIIVSIIVLIANFH